MSKPRSFTRREIMDAARAAAETGLCARLCPTGEIIFTQEEMRRIVSGQTPEDLLEGWLNENKPRRRA